MGPIKKTKENITKLHAQHRKMVESKMVRRKT
jgi:hypothetical protein